MTMKVTLVTLLVFTCVSSQEETAAPVPILRQIHDVNDDGSYTFGYEAADGTFKVENRDNQGNVKGKYGYLDETGQLKTVEYSAGKETGFTAQANHLPVAVLPKSVPVAEPAPSFRVPVPDRTVQGVSEPVYVQTANLPSNFYGHFSHYANSAPHNLQHGPTPHVFLQQLYNHDRAFGYAYSAPTFAQQQYAAHPFRNLFNRFLHL